MAWIDNMVDFISVYHVDDEGSQTIELANNAFKEYKKSFSKLSNAEKRDIRNNREKAESFLTDIVADVTIDICNDIETDVAESLIDEAQEHVRKVVTNKTIGKLEYRDSQNPIDKRIFATNGN